MSAHRTAGLVAVLLAGAMSRISATDCVLLNAGTVAKYSDAVFRGTVIATDTTTITFDVERVWKGRISRRVTVHVDNRRLIGFTPVLGTKYLAFAHRPTDEDRNALSLADRQVYVFGPCGDGTRPWEMISARDIRALEARKTTSAPRPR